MPCEICGRSNCMRCFHSLEEQEEFDTKTGRYAPDDDNGAEKVVERVVERVVKMPTQKKESRDIQKLKSCPFCGSPAVLEHELYNRLWRVYCPNMKCALTMPYRNTKQEAIEQWDTRANA